MKQTIRLAAQSIFVALTFTGAALAGSLTDPIVESPVEKAIQDDWQGLRFGLTYNGEIQGNTLGTSEGFPFINAGNVKTGNLGGFVGFDLQRGNWILGAELQRIQRDNGVIGFPARFHKDLDSLRARVGYSTGKTLWYGSLGVAQSQFDDAGTLMDMTGHVAGLGVERKLGKKAFVGFAIDHYTLSGERLATVIDAKHTVAQLRLGFVF